VILGILQHPIYIQLELIIYNRLGISTILELKRIYQYVWLAKVLGKDMGMGQNL
jgi:hypothetical protein